MKRIAQYGFTGIVFLATISPAFAEVAAREDNSMALVYVFLGVCGLIIMLQMIPVFALAYGIIKGIFSGQESAAKPVHVRNR